MLSDRGSFYDGMTFKVLHTVIQSNNGFTIEFHVIGKELLFYDSEEFYDGMYLKLLQTMVPSKYYIL